MRDSSILLSIDLVPVVAQDPGCRVSTITGSLESNIGAEVKHASYHMLWRARERANNKLYGDEGYTLLPSLCERILSPDPQSGVGIRKDAECRYEGCFIAPGRLFSSPQMRRVVSKDAIFSASPLCRVAAVVLLGEAWSGKPGFESHRQPLCSFGGVGRKRLAPSSCTGESIRGVLETGAGPFPPAAAGQWFDGDRGCGAVMGSGLKSTAPHLS